MREPGSNLRLIGLSRVPQGFEGGEDAGDLIGALFGFVAEAGGKGFRGLAVGGPEFAEVSTPPWREGNGVSSSKNDQICNRVVILFPFILGHFEAFRRISNHLPNRQDHHPLITQAV